MGNKIKRITDILAEFIDKSGLRWETKLKELLTLKTYRHADIKRLLTGDIKGLLSKFIASNISENDPFSRLVSLIKNVQLLNHFGFEQDGKIFIPLPLPLADGYFTVGQLLIQLDQYKNKEPRKKTRENGLFRISFLLELSNLGPVRADLAVRDKQITGRFLTIKEETKYVIEKNLPSFIEAFKKRGFSIFHLECHIREPKQVGDSLIREIIRKESCNISLIA
ncbi:MAG: flagellar hook-length control protein FliK [Desulfobacterales bacterium]